MSALVKLSAKLAGDDDLNASTPIAGKAVATAVKEMIDMNAQAN